MSKRNLLVAIAAVGFFGVLTVGENAFRPHEKRDTTVLLALTGDVNELSQEAIKSQQDRVIKSIANEVTTNYFVEKRFSEATNAIKLTINSSHLSELSKLENVKAADIDAFNEYDNSVDSPIDVEINEAVAAVKGRRQVTPTYNISAKTMNVPTSGTNEGAGVLVAVLDDGFYLEHEAFTELGSGVPVKFTKEEIDKVSLKNAKGAKEGANSLWYNSKVPFKYDYGEDNDDDPISWDTHGTHTAGIVGSNGSYKGVAPNCQLALMKVFTESGTADNPSTGAYDSDVLEALEDCLRLDVDVVSMSFGSPLREVKTTTAVQEAWQTLSLRGVMCNHSAGNEGKNNFSSFASGYFDLHQTEFGIQNYDVTNKYVNSIGSVQPDEYYYETALIVNGKVVNYLDQVTNYKSSDNDVEYEQERYLTDLIHDEQNEFEFVRVPGLGEAADFNDIDVAGKIAVIDRGEITFREKIENAVAHDASAVIIIDNDASATELNFRFDLTNQTTGKLYNPPVPCVSVLYRDRVLFGDPKSNGTATLLADIITSNPTAKVISDFSSEGYKADLTIKPDIMAPGTDIYSSVNGAYNETTRKYEYDSTAYDYASGTSMSCPNFSGACAVYLGEFADNADNFHDAKIKLMRKFQSTAEICMTDDSTPVMDTPRKVGAGLASVADAIATEQYLEGYELDGKTESGFAKINLVGNESLSNNGIFNFNFLGHNDGKDDVTYNIKLLVGRQRVGQYDNSNYPNFEGKNLMMNKDDTIAELDAGTVTLKAGEKTVISINNVTIPDDALNKISVYEGVGDNKHLVVKDIKEVFPNGNLLEGYVVLTPTEAGFEPLNIPYAGFYGDYQNAETVEPFVFERDNSQIYLSDIMNTVGKLYTNYQKTSTEFVSDMVVYSSNSTSLNTSSIYTNDSNIYKFGEPIGLNPITGERATGSADDPLIVGNNGASDKILVQQSVYKTCADNDVFIIDNETGRVAYKTKMNDLAFGGPTLQKTMPVYSDSFISTTVFGSRALGILDVSELEDGEYTILFHYDNLAGGEFEKELALVVDSSLPEIKSIDTIEIENNSYYRIRIDGQFLTAVYVRGTMYDIDYDDEGSYIDVPVNDLKGGNIVLFEVTNLAYGNSKGMVHVDDKQLFTVFSNGTTLTNQHDFTVNVEAAKESKYTRDNFVTVIVTRRGSAVSNYNNFDVAFKLWDGWSTNPDDILIFDYNPTTDKYEELEDIDFEITENGAVKFNTYAGQFEIIDKSSDTTIPVDPVSSSEDTGVEPVTSSEGTTTAIGPTTTDTSAITPTSETSIDPNPNQGLSGGAIAGIAVGGVCGVSIIAAVIVVILKGKH